MRKLFNNKAQKELRQRLRNEPAPAEVFLWKHLRSAQTGHKFRRQYGVGPYVVDFYCPEAKLAIELDGDSHYEPGAEEKDFARQKFIESKGIRVLRLTNIDIRESPDDVMEIIERHLPPTPPNLPSEMGGDAL